MFHHSFLKITVLVSLCLGALLVSSNPAPHSPYFTLECRGFFSGGSHHEAIVACQPGRDSLAQKNCKNWGCFHSGNKWVELDNCILDGTSSGFSKQQCVGYSWLPDLGRFGCHNHGRYFYQCDGTPETIPFITCTMSCYDD
ncbi:uncharacterized protein MELLADRAFT_123830 [Melampsora larici-populina 98AG31]|uniref:Secreted protein n=1 Tax=Melampsora larici-populina (strain 98AG31 / pathotype 3-4-7) TaxID=747676 RepID=F4RAV8_MELLP|nr:uncharacterized protein MELLADRAFT_123830 [Melampsora larici-populina 98AG31]EGG10709.1 secreted protein [Melampsora larici-populina 98AG31]